MIDLSRVHAAIVDLHALIAGDDRLRDFLPAADELLAQVSELVDGRPSAVQPLSAPTRQAALPDREVALRVVECVSKIPSIDGDEPEELLRLYGQLRGNVVDCVLYAVFDQYPDLIPHKRVRQGE